MAANTLDVRSSISLPTPCRCPTCIHTLYVVRRSSCSIPPVGSLFPLSPWSLHSCLFNFYFDFISIYSSSLFLFFFHFHSRHRRVTRIVAWLCLRLMDAEVDLTEYNGDALVITASLFLALTWASVVLRTYVRVFLTKAYQADDWLMLLSQVSQLAPLSSTGKKKMRLITICFWTRLLIQGICCRPFSRFLAPSSSPASTMASACTTLLSTRIARSQP